jgi:L-lactate dehydrogenase complex protein LldG
VEGAAMSGREQILAEIRARRLAQAPKPQRYSAPKIEGDLVEAFAKRLSAQHAEVRILNSMAEVPEAVADVLRARNMAARIHLPSDSPLASLALGGVEVRGEPPSAFDAALTVAPFAIAETGTLAYPARKVEPASWHFRPLLEIAVLRASDIVGELEEVLAKLGTLPSTLNLVSGPSRTGDIEQTMELGAHGPKALTVLVVKE